jgi:hypothetical protein
MLWTVFMLVMLAWMLSLFLKFQLGAIPLVIVLTITLAFIKVLRRSSFIWGAGLGSGSLKNRAERPSMRRLLKVISTKEETKCLKSRWVMKFLLPPANPLRRGLGRETWWRPKNVRPTIFISRPFHVTNAKDPSLPGGPGREKMT